MAIFGKRTARQRLRAATRESLTVPTFGSAVDCTPWATGGLWPAELSVPTAQTRGLADYLRSDLQRIARRANDELTTIKRANIAAPVRRTHEARIIAAARAHAVRRIESTLRQQQMIAAARYRPRNGAALADLDKTRVMPAITASPPAQGAAADPLPGPRHASNADDHHTPTKPLVTGSAAVSPNPDNTGGGRHRAPEVEHPADNTSTSPDGFDPPNSVSS